MWQKTADWAAWSCPGPVGPETVGGRGSLGTHPGCVQGWEWQEAWEGAPDLPSGASRARLCSLKSPE